MTIRLTIAAVTVATALLSLPAVAADAPLKLVVPQGEAVTLAPALPTDLPTAQNQTKTTAPASQPSAPASSSSAPGGQAPRTFQLTIKVDRLSKVCLGDCYVVEPNVPITLTITADTLAEGLKLIYLKSDPSSAMTHLAGQFWNRYMEVSVDNGPPFFVQYDTTDDKYKRYPPFSTYLPPAVLAQFKAPSC